MSAATAKSLAVAHELREDGFTSLLDAQPEVRDAFIVLWQRGESLRESQRQLMEQFPDSHVPSVKALSNYVRNHLKHSTIDSRSPEYVQMAAKYDTVRQMYRIVSEMERRYQFAVAAKCSFRTTNNLLKMLMDANLKVLEMELKLGLRQSGLIPDNPEPSQPSENIEENLDRAVDLVQSFEEFKAKVEWAQIIVSMPWRNNYAKTDPKSATLFS